MKHSKTLGISTAFVALGLFFSGCAAQPIGNAGTEGAQAEGEITAGELPENCATDTPVLGVALPDASNPYYVAMRKGFEEIGEKTGFDVKVAIADSDDSQQLAQIESFIEQKVCAVALNPVSSGPSAASVAALNKAGIPVFTVNVLVSAPDLEKQDAEVTQFVGADQAQGGTAMAELALKDLGADATIVAGIVGFPDSVTTNQRDEGFTEGLSSNANATVKTTVNGKVDPNVSLQVTSDMLQGNPEMNVVFGDTGPATLGALQAVIAAGLSETVSVYGFCAADTKLEGPYRGCAAQEPYDYARIVVENVRSFIDGDAIQRTILRPLKVFVSGETPGEGLLG